MERVTFDFFFMFECRERDREKRGNDWGIKLLSVLIVPRKRHPSKAPETKLWKVETLSVLITQWHLVFLELATPFISTLYV